MASGRCPRGLSSITSTVEAFWSVCCRCSTLDDSSPSAVLRRLSSPPHVHPTWPIMSLVPAIRWSELPGADGCPSVGRRKSSLAVGSFPRHPPSRFPCLPGRRRHISAGRVICVLAPRHRPPHGCQLLAVAAKTLLRATVVRSEGFITVGSFSSELQSLQMLGY